jgi:hypothetical protein
MGNVSLESPFPFDLRITDGPNSELRTIQI